MSVTLPAKSCKQQQSLEFNTVCTDCKLTGCLNCEQSGADRCDVCDQGLYYDSTQNKCLDCDEYDDAVLCRKCDGYNQCTECNVGYRLGQYGTDWQGRCRPCDEPQCALCNELTGECDECREGWFLKNQECVKCSGVCTKCKDENTCLACDEKKSTLNEETGQCECNESGNWFADIDNPQNCVCSGQYISFDGTCLQTCSDLIDGCSTCEDKGNEASPDYKYLGPPPAERPDQSQYVTCTSCNGNRYYDTDRHKCTFCHTTTPGCTACDQNTGMCQRCNEVSFLVRNSGVQTCVVCHLRFDDCKHCSESSCTQCYDDYFVLSGECYNYDPWGLW